MSLWVIFTLKSPYVADQWQVKVLISLQKDWLNEDGCFMGAGLCQKFWMIQGSKGFRKVWCTGYIMCLHMDIVQITVKYMLPAPTDLRSKRVLLVHWPSHVQSQKQAPWWQEWWTPGLSFSETCLLNLYKTWGSIHCTISLWWLARRRPRASYQLHQVQTVSLLGRTSQPTWCMSTIKVVSLFAVCAGFVCVLYR